jgi:thiamine biosynthesis lipoprotein
MGSPCEAQLFAPSPAALDEAVRRVVEDVERLEARYSRYRETSLLSEINRVAARGGAIEVDDETAALLDYAQACHEQSGGLFDITSGVLRRAWRFDGGALPEPGLVARLLETVGWDRLNWRAPRLAFPRPGLELDLGGVVKEYAADRAAILAREAGATGGAINLGGDIRIVGPRPDGTPWRVGVRHPRVAGEVARTVRMTGGAMATSGDYERCLVIDGVRYGHILDPRTGWPVRGLASVSVVADLCVVAGSAATIAMLKGAEGPAWLEAEGLDCLWITPEGEVGGSLASRHVA